MSYLLHGEACNFQRARNNKPEDLVEMKGERHSLPASVWRFLPPSPQLWSLAVASDAALQTF